MASVYHFFCKASTFSKYVFSENRNLEQPGKERHYAALIIQRAFRGYKVREMVKYWHAMATRIQKVFRGWLVRYHLPEHYSKYLIRINEEWYHKMAVRIQARWKGYKARRQLGQKISDIMKNKKLMESANVAMRDLIRAQFQKMRTQPGIGGLSDEEKIKVGNECKQWVLYILFKTHHMLRTQCKEGIYSNHGENKLSQIEEWMTKLPMQQYMDDLRTLYNRHYTKQKPIHYMFKDRKYRKCEYFFRTRDRSRELKVEPLKIEVDLHDKPFDLYKKPKKEPYSPSIIGKGTFDSSSAALRQFKKIYPEFDLFVHQMMDKVPDVPPYYINSWFKRCKLHYAEDD